MIVVKQCALKNKGCPPLCASVCQQFGESSFVALLMINKSGPSETSAVIISADGDQ